MNVAIEDISSELSSVNIYQKRTISNVDVTKADSTVLEDNVYIAGSNFAENCDFKNISSFEFNIKNDTLSVKLGNLEYSQVLSERASSSGLGNQYDVAQKVIKGGMETTLKLTNSETEDFLSINLQSVSDIDVSTAKKAADFMNALNALFSSEGNSGLLFQVGEKLDDVVTITFQDIGLDALYKDAEGNAYTENNTLNKEAAAKSFAVIENALEYLKTEIASTGAVTNQFMSIDKKLSSVIEPMSEAAADYVAESLKLQAATTAHSYHNSVVKELVSSILRG